MSFLEIFPQSVTIKPSDRQLFTARTTPPPAMWSLIVNGTVQSDFALLVDPGFTGSGNSAHQLNSGVGSLEFQITDNCRPIASGGPGQYSWIVYIQGVPLPFAYQIDVNPSNVVIKDETFATIATISHTVASGDIFRVELAATFRLFINGTLRHERIAFSSAVSYPLYYAVSLIPPVAGSSAKIPQPKLSGDWGLRPIVAFTAPSQGSITPLTSSQTTYFNGTVPGVYTLTARIDAAHDPNGYQKATATIIIPPLSILGEKNVTLQPGEKVRFKTNYDDAQNPLIAWSVVSGSGSFLNGEFTAGTAPGTTVVRATAASAGNQTADITVTVPAVVTPSFEAATLGEVITFTTNLTGSVTWSATCGTPTGSGSTFLWTAPNQAGLTCKVTATNGTLTKTYDIAVLKKFPYDRHSPVSGDGNKTALISDAEDRSRSSRVKDKGGLSFRTAEFTFNNRDRDEFLDAYDFWDQHYPGKKAIFEDKVLGRRFVMYFDSNIRWTENTDCSIDYAFRVKQANV